MATSSDKKKKEKKKGTLKAVAGAAKPEPGVSNMAKSAPKAAKPAKAAVKATKPAAAGLKAAKPAKARAPKPEKDKKRAGAPAKVEPLLSSDFPIVGMGASAGGLEAFEQFFTHMPSDKGIAFVLVPHLDPGHASMMVDLLRRFTAMDVSEAGEGDTVKPNHVYVIPPNKDMVLSQGRLYLTVPQAVRGQRMPIDFFLRSLADDRGDRAIGIILSGTGTDGTLGLRAIQGAGGMSMVQDPVTARYDGMPRSAVAAGLADYVLPPEKMGEQLTVYVRRVYGTKAMPPSLVGAPASIQRMLMLLRSRTGHDFSLYKKNTIRRRIQRRMGLHNLESLADYLSFLQSHPEEVNLLFKELLINVTSFFREPPAFDVLKKALVPKLFLDKDEDYVFRVWVVGCATGEEAYSIAMVFREYAEDSGREYKLQMFATDIDEDSISIARAGLYPANIAADVSADRLKRFFVKEEGGFRIKKDIRESIVFATQDVIRDAPFTKLDLISCRNLLIYLEPELQNRLLRLFHYSLRPKGYLFLGSSESIGTFADLYSVVDMKWKFYRSKQVVAASHEALVGGMPWAFTPAPREPAVETKKVEEINIQELAHRVLLHALAPASVVVNEKGDILYVHGDTGKFLRPAPGQPTLNVFEMAKESVQVELRTAFQSAVTHRKDVVYREIMLRENGGVPVTITVRPLAEKMAGQRLYIIVFGERPQAQEAKPVRTGRRVKKEGAEKRYEDLEGELRYTRENLQATIEELQASNEELQSMNEELQSTNEELQSTNEELETSKEELQSVNEELVTVNSELQSKIEQLSVA